MTPLELLRALGSQPVPHPYSEGVDLVEEDDAGRAEPRTAEYGGEGLFALADVLGEELGTLDGEEVHVGLGGHRLRQQRLRTAWNEFVMMNGPGGPYNKTPFGGDTWKRASLSAKSVGHSMSSRSFDFTFSSPPTSLQCTWVTITT